MKCALKSKLFNAGLSAEKGAFLLTYAASRRTGLTAGVQIPVRKSAGNVHSMQNAMEQL
ncbi:MAG: hypothetical protein LBQ51_03190 [Desulfovibrio sp.]|jgi:hypothetical protein|nr:hypothetical protein [Desulfovibrio sp.]